MKNDKLIACIVECTAEEVIVNKLLEHDKLIFTKKEILEEQLLKERKGCVFEEKYLRKEFDSKILIYRIIDSKNEKFKISRFYQEKVSIIDVITAPEIEMLVIIKSGKYDDFSNKYKKRMKPSDYCKQILKIPNVKSKEFLEFYFADIDELVSLINKYSSLHGKIPKGKKCLADILK